MSENNISVCQYVCMSICHYVGIYQKVQPLKSSTTYGLNFLITEKFNYGVEQFDYQKVQPIYFMTL